LGTNFTGVGSGFHRPDSLRLQHKVAESSANRDAMPLCGAAIEDGTYEQKNISFFIKKKLHLKFMRRFGGDILVSYFFVQFSQLKKMLYF